VSGKANPARSTLQPQQSYRTSPQRLFGPRLVFTRDDAFGSDKSISTARRILIVEDDFLVADQMENILKDAGFVVSAVVTSAEEAVEAAAAPKPDLVIMDIRLAGKRDGVGAAIELFENLGIRCIFATAHSDPMMQKRAEAARPLGWLQKPYSMASLLQTVRNAFEVLDSN
jgi:two-component system, response regulator PdtaR